jgi:predicted DNA-binding transcriptional regulator YafY
VLETSTRLLDLLSLLQARANWTGSELADRLEVDGRTLRRDVERLRRLGYPIEARRGREGGYRLAAGSTVPPLLLDDEEAVAVAVGLRNAAGLGISGIEETSVRALAKLESLLPSRLRRRVATIGAATVTSPGAGPLVEPELLARLGTACREHQGMRFGYRSRRDVVSRRRVEPLSLVHSGHRWYLVAFDRDRDDWRTFRVDRIEGRPSEDTRFAPRPPPHPDLAAYVADRVGETRDAYRAEIVLHAPASQLQRQVPAQYGTLEEIDDRTCLLRTGAPWLGGIAVYVAMLGVDFEVRSPPELRELLGVLAGRFAAAADPATRRRERPGGPDPGRERQSSD